MDSERNGHSAHEHPAAAAHIDQLVLADMAPNVYEVHIDAPRLMAEAGRDCQFGTCHDTTGVGPERLEDGSVARVEEGARKWCVVHIDKPTDTAFPGRARIVSGSLQSAHAQRVQSAHA